MEMAGIILAIVAPVLMVAIFRRLPWPDDMQVYPAPKIVVAPRRTLKPASDVRHPHAA